MKKLLLLLTAIIIFSFNLSLSQEGRPQYQIRNERAGEYIGDIIIELFPYVAPLHVANFDSLVSISFYDTTAWHRVVPNFVIQGGDPNSRHGPRNTWGEGDSTQTTVPAEFSKVSHLRGIIGAARDADINSATSQFYINTANNTGLDGNYTAYGVVVEGMDVADDIESSERDENDNPIEKIEMFITKIGVNETAPDPPEMIEPEDNFEGFQKSTNITWTDAANSVLSFIEISSDSNFTQVEFADSFGVSVDGTTSVKFPDAELGRETYYWRVRSNNGAKFSEYSEIRSFTTSIFSPNPLLPENNAENVSTSPLIQWEAVEGASSYRLQIAKDFPSFTDARIIFDEGNIKETEKMIEGLELDTRYYWHVLAETETYESPYSRTWLFTTLSATGVNEENLPNEFYLYQNYPNPFNPVSTIKFDVPKLSKIKIAVYDIMGREVELLVDKEMNLGSYNITFDGNNLASGVYYYKLTADGFSMVRKMLLVK